jgi:hypothetical protein
LGHGFIGLSLWLLNPLLLGCDELEHHSGEHVQWTKAAHPVMARKQKEIAHFKGIILVIYFLQIGHPF